MNKKEVVKTFSEAEVFFKKYKISGIFFIPGYGSATIFRNDVDKLVILDHASLEQDVENKKREDEIKHRIANEISIYDSPIPKYIR